MAEMMTEGSTGNFTSDGQYSSDSDLDLLISNTKQVKLSASPTFIFSLLGPVGEKLITPTSISIAKSGEIAVTDPESCFLVIYSHHGDYLSHFSTLPKKTFYLFLSIEEYKPHDVAWLSNKRIVFTQPKGSRIVIADWMGKYHVIIEGRPLYEPYGVKVDNCDNIFVTDRQKGRIMCYNSVGKLTQMMGKFGCNNVLLTSPQYIQLSNNGEKFFVSQILKGNPVISIYKRDGKLMQHLYTESKSELRKGISGHFVITHDRYIVQTSNASNDKSMILIYQESSPGTKVRNGHTQSSKDVHVFNSYDMGYHISAIALDNNGNLACINTEDKAIQIYPLQEIQDDQKQNHGIPTSKES